MQIPSITNFATSSVNCFLESSWKGKTVQVLGLFSIFALLYWIFQKKAPLRTSDTPSTPLSERVEKPAMSENELKQKESFEKAKRDAVRNGNRISLHIQEYDITDQHMLFEIAKISAARDGDETSQYIKDYGITDQNMLFEIAKIAVAQGNRTSQYIQNYGIIDQDRLFEIATIAAARSGWSTSQYIENYGIIDQGRLFEIAKIAAAQNGNKTSEYIKNYGITDQEMLVEIAKIAAADSGLGTSQHIESYGITDQKMLLEIAKIAAAQDGFRTSQYIQKYGITDQEMLVEIAKIAAAANGWGTSEYIQNYDITDQKMLVEIAKIAAANSGKTSQYIEKYRITDQDRLVEIAKIAAAQNGSGTSEYIQNYGITDQKMLVEIAKIAAAQNGSGTSQYIENYGIIDQDGLVEIAKIVAIEDVKAINENIQKYRITDQNKRVEIAKIAAAQDGYEISRSILNYGITDQNMLFEIAKIAAAQDGWGTSQNFHNYCLSEDQRLQIFQICLTQIVRAALETNDFSTLEKHAKTLKVFPSGEKLFEVVAKTCALKIPFHFETTENKQKVEENLRDAFKQLKDFALEFGASEKVLASLEEMIFIKHTSLLQQQKDLLWLGAWMMHYSLDLAEDILKQSPLGDEKMLPLLHCISKTTNSNLRCLATSALTSGYKNYETVLEILMGADERLYLTVLFSTVAGIETETTKKICSELCPSRKDTKLMAPVNELMGALCKSSSLSLEEKEPLLGLIFQPPIKGDRERQLVFKERLTQYRKDQQKWISAVHSLLYFGQDEILKNITNTKELVDEWKTFMGKTFYIKDDVVDKFFSTFVQSKRYPSALIIYTTRLQKLPKIERDQLMPLLGKFANAVLDETFHQMRYSFTDNIHLETVFSGNEELLKKWKTSLPIKMDNQEGVIDKTPLEQVQKLMRNALDHHHLGTEPIENDILRKCEIVLNSKTTEPELKSALMELQKLFPSAAVQFHHDLKGMLASLETPQSSVPYTIEDTDDWEDLVLMGTEVDMSCQHINGDPANNKCLLAAILDGKIRLMVAREKGSGKILGRVIYRTLLDENNKRVLFVDALYTRIGVNSQLVRQHIFEGCRQKAQSMGIPLTASVCDYKDLNAKKYPSVLKSLGGPAPYEYVDATYGINMGGIYSIPGSYLVWSP